MFFRARPNEVLTFGFISDTNKVSNMEVTFLDGAVGVEVGFWGTRVIPLRFVWNGRRYEVKRITMNFERRDGGRRYKCFAVDTGGMVAELRLDREELTWRLAAVDAG